MAHICNITGNKMANVIRIKIVSMRTNSHMIHANYVICMVCFI